MDERIKVDDYGDMIAKLRNMKLLHYECYGDYQGEYLAVLLDEDTPKRVFIYKGDYGSCSGCDWFEDAKDWKTDTVDYKEANDYCAQMTPLFILPLREYKPDFFASLYHDVNDKYAAYNFNFGEKEAKVICIAILKELMIKIKK